MNRFQRNCICFLLVVWLFTCANQEALAQFSNSSFVIDSGGSASTNASFRNLSAIGQGSPVGFTSNGENLNYSGFLNTFLLAPHTDTDMDGVADENDPDDDGDFLLDTTELVGSGFNPSTVTDPLSSDSDGDGFSDGAESVAGTNPADPANVLTILSATTTVSVGDVIEWKSRGGMNYQVLQAGSVDELVSAPVVIGPFTASGGTGVWFETTSFSPAIPTTGAKTFYGVQVLP